MVPESDHEQRHGGATGRLTQSTSRWPRPVPLAEATHTGSPRPHWQSRSWHPAHAARLNAGRELRRPHSELHWQPEALANCANLNLKQAGPGRGGFIVGNAGFRVGSDAGPGPGNFPRCLAWTSRYDC